MNKREKLIYYFALSNGIFLGGIMLEGLILLGIGKAIDAINFITLNILFIIWFYVSKMFINSKLKRLKEVENDEKVDQIKETNIS